LDKNSIAKIYSLANKANWEGMLQACAEFEQSASDDQLPELADALLAFGFVSEASRLCTKAPSFRASAILARIATDCADHGHARRLYDDLIRQYPNSGPLRSNALVSLEYESGAVDRLAQAKAWGKWAVARAGGVLARPAVKTLQGRALRVGFVSGDLCLHTVGLFVKDVIKSLEPDRVCCWAYSTGSVRDWVTREIESGCTLRDVRNLDDGELAARIRSDAIDVLVDLSGHTGGSRLSAFALRPAPVLVSWLGYFATTGLPYMDAVLLDPWHAPPGTEAEFAEPIIRLPSRFCYQSVPWAPEIAPRNAGPITFGSFNNTAKLNAQVYDLWSRILLAVPESRLVLKWRTFNDETYCSQVRAEFAQRGIAQTRIDLRGPSFHRDVFKQHAEIDIALDPFPFTGGLTSCEALWMGVPVVTWPQARVVSRQSHAILSLIGLSELSAKNADDYVRIAAELALDPVRLAAIRESLRQRMVESVLMDLPSYTQRLEDTLIDLHDRIEDEERQKLMNARTVLHVGPGHRKSGARLPEAFQGEGWKELRLDIDPINEPDILGSMLDMGAVADTSVDAIFSAHNIEHVHTHEVPRVLSEFLRVIKPEGFLVITCPDLQTVCQLVVEDKLTEAAYTSQAGAITPLDILYGHSQAVAEGHHYMAHKTGFTLKSLTQELHRAGFQSSAGKRRARGLDLWVLATPVQTDEARLRALAQSYLPS
jgi:protein O-GlcNAc transferase